MAPGIKDKVAIIGMGCTRFGERWDMGAEELMVEAFEECLADAGIEKKDIGAAWLGTCFDSINVGKSALPLSMTLRLPNIPVTRVENYCATGTEAFRGACYAVAAGAYDIALALGVEKLKDTGYGGLPSFTGSDSGSLTWQWFPNMTAPGAFAQLASAYAAKYKIADQDLKRAMAHVSAKSHANGALNPKAHLRKAVSEDQIMAAPIIAHPLGLFDCCGVSDGAACAIVTTPELAKQLGKKEIVSHHQQVQHQGIPGSGHHPSQGRDQHDGGARLLFHHGAGYHGRPAYFRTRPGLARCDGRCFRSRRPGPLSGRWRVEMFRPSHRRLGFEDAL